MLRTVLDEIRQAQGPMTLAELSRRTHVAVTALEPMIDLLARKGLLEEPTPSNAAPCHSGGCGTSCSPAACPFVVSMPRVVKLNLDSHPR